MYAAVLLLTIALTTVEGRVTAGGFPLPGTTVTLRCESWSRATVADAEGSYRFAGVGPGVYDLTFTLDGLETATERIVAGGETRIMQDAELRISPAESITLSCTLGAVCSEFLPADWSDLPACADYELDSALIEAANKGDSSALQMIERRHASATTYRQRSRLAAALLRRSSKDAAIWAELMQLADVVMRFPKAGVEPDDEEYLQWCAARSLAPAEHWSMALDALHAASADPRSRPLLLHILDDEASPLLSVAITGLATQRDFAALPVIDRALSIAGKDAGQLAFALALFADERADAVARKHLSEAEAADYDEGR